MNAPFVGLLGNTELLLILAIVVLLFGVGKLPQVGKQLGEGIRNFKKELAPGETPELPAAAEVVAPRDVTDEHQAKQGSGTSP